MKNLLLVIISLFLTINTFSQCENDSINPYFVNFESEVTISCDVDLNVLFPVALDECDDSVEIAWYEETTNIYCDNSYDLFRVYRAFDDFGNQSVESQIIHVVDETSPTFQPIENQVIDCGGIPVFSQPIVTDNCGFIVTTNEDFVDSTDNCQISYIRLWTAYDQCGNTSNLSQTIIVTDMTPPVITGEIYLEVNEGDNIDTTFITVTDNCSSFEVTYVDSEVSGHNIIRNYTATDACGNESTFEQIININHDEDEEEGGGGNNRVAICHNLGNGEWITIYVAEPAVPAHLAHGDYLGPCTQMIIDWQQILPNSDLQMRVIKDYDNKYKKFVKVK
jgi:hypothetical protein